MKAALSSGLALSLILAACEQTPSPGPPPSPEEQSRVRSAGNEIADNLVKTLGGQMKAALKSGGPVAAVTVCQSAAQPLTTSVTANMPEATVRRTALRIRNPINAPDPVDRTVLEELAATPSDQLPPEMIRWTSDTARFYKPLVTQEVCMKCHGNPDTFSPALRDLLRTAYPDDQATGFTLGELRGVIRVDFQRSSP